MCHPLSTYPNIHLPSTRVSLNETCWASFRFYSNLLNLLTESHPAVAPSSVQSFFWTTVPFDFAVGHCNLVRKDERSHLVRLQELEPGDGAMAAAATPRCQRATWRAINENIRLDVPRIFQKLFQEDLKCPRDSQLHGKKLMKSEIYKTSSV